MYTLAKIFNYIGQVVDFHWHARGLNHSHKDTIEHSLAVALASGVGSVAAMPNPEPPLISLEGCNEYLALAKGSPVEFFVHIGLTSDAEQIKRAVEATRLNKRICGIKVYWGHSTGRLGIVDELAQRLVLKTLAECGFDGVLVGHFEDESCMNDKLYIPENPMSWSTHCRPENAEVSSFTKILKMAEEFNFKGTLHVAHVSTTAVVDYINSYMGSVKLSCGVTPHHLRYDNSFLAGHFGEQYKCNPPLRSESTRVGLLERVLDGRIPIIESDHAPHSADDKRAKIPASGISSGAGWPYFVSWLVNDAGMSLERLKAVVSDNVVKLYGANMESRLVQPDLAKLAVLSRGYPYVPPFR